MSFQTKLELHALAGLFLTLLRCEQRWAEQQGWEQKTSCTPCSLEGRKVTAASQWDHLSCVWNHQKGTDEYCIWQCMETPAITVLPSWRNVATNPGEQHFILVQVKLQMCGTTEGHLNSWLSEKFCSTESSDSRCCSKIQIFSSNTLYSGCSLEQQSLSLELSVIQNIPKGNFKQVSLQEAFVIFRTSFLWEVAPTLALLENCASLSGVLNTTCRWVCRCEPKAC